MSTLPDRIELRGLRLVGIVGVLPEERELVSIDPGYRRSSPTSRLDSFLTTSAFQSAELNAESPAGIAYFEELTRLNSRRMRSARPLLRR